MYKTSQRVVKQILVAPLCWSLFAVGVLLQVLGVALDVTGEWIEGVADELWRPGNNNNNNTKDYR